MLKQEPFRNKEIFNHFFNSSDICYGSKKFVGSGSVDQHIFADPKY